MGEPKKTRAKRKGAAGVVEAVAESIHAANEELEPVAAVEHRPETHAFAYPKDSNLMRCSCGAEQDLRVVGGKAVRFYRGAAADAWTLAIGLCPKYVAPPAPEPKSEPPKEQVGVARVFTEVLRKHNPGMFEPEIIDGVDVDKAAEDVDLDIACSPVLRCVRGGIYPQSDEEQAAMIPIEVTPLDGGKYRVFFDDGPRDMDAETVKVMRARFLLQRQALSKALYQIPEPPRSQWAKLYKITWLPPEGSALHTQLMTGGVISIPRDDDKPVDFLALARALTTPGMDIPAVCPVIAENAETADATEWHEFAGNDNCSDCRGWDGKSQRCDCGNRRVYWDTSGEHRFARAD